MTVTAATLQPEHVRDVVAHGNRFDRACAERLLYGCVSDESYDALAMDRYLVIVGLTMSSLQLHVARSWNSRHGAGAATAPLLHHRRFACGWITCGEQDPHAKDTPDAIAVTCPGCIAELRAMELLP